MAPHSRSTTPRRGRPVLLAWLVVALVAAGCSGDGSDDGEDGRRYHEPATVEELPDVTSIDVGGWHSCAVRADESLACWGANGHGQLGDSSRLESGNPVAVEGITDASIVSVGDEATCSVLNDGSVWCWGQNYQGLLGNSSVAVFDGWNRFDPFWSALPVRVERISGAAAVDVGLSHACAVLVDGSVSCWGAYSRGQLGDPALQDDLNSLPEERYRDAASSLPVAVDGVTGATAVVVGSSHSCALIDDGSVSCWGDNGSGQLGGEPNAQRWSAARVEGVAGAVEIGVSGDTTCALRGDGAIICWGQILGSVDHTGLYDSPTVLLDEDRPAKTFSVGESRLCAVLDDGDVFCGEEQTADSVDEPGGSYVVVRNFIGRVVDGVGDAARVSVDGGGACAVLTAGGVSCWVLADYSGPYPQPTSPEWDSARAPAAVGEVSDAVAVSSSMAVGALIDVIGPGGDYETGHHTPQACAVLSDGSITCWIRVATSAERDGQRLREIHVEVEGIEDAVAVSTESSRACGQLDDGDVLRWDMDLYDKGLYAPFFDADRSHSDSAFRDFLASETLAAPVPRAVADLSDVAALSSSYPTCATLVDGVSCWRTEGLFDLVASPVQGFPDGSAAAVASGPDFDCAVLDDRSVSCWGSNILGVLGNGSLADTDEPVAVQGIDDVTEISAGTSHVCALRSDGSVWCWGDNGSGQLGADVAGDHSTRPVAVPGVSDVDAVSAGAGYTCALLSDGSVSCWGDNTVGQLGAKTDDRYSDDPVTVEGSRDVVAISAGSGYPCTLDDSGDVICWGTWY